LISAADLAIRDPTMMSVHLVAHGGMDAKIGAKKREMKNAIPVKMAVRQSCLLRKYPLRFLYTQ
jgi:hypothetical protein